MKQYNVSQICSKIACRMTTFKIPTYDGIKLYHQQVKHPQKWPWKDCTSQNCRILLSFRLLALYGQETVRNGVHPSCSRLRTSVRVHIDPTMRTRNFRVRNEVVERGSVTKSQKGKEAFVERKVGEPFQWKAKGQCSKGDSCSFRHEPACGNRREDHRVKWTITLSRTKFEGQD